MLGKFKLLAQTDVEVNIQSASTSRIPARNSEFESGAPQSFSISPLSCYIFIFLRLCLDSFLCLFRGRLQVRLQLFPLQRRLCLCSLEALVVLVNSSDLGCANNEHKRVDSSQSDVLRPDDEAPARPDGACAHEGKILGEGKRLSRAGEIRGTGEDHAPFHYWSPEMHRLGANRAVPEPRKARRLSARSGVDSSASIPRLSEEGPEAGEDAGAGAERHGCRFFPSLPKSRVAGR